MIFKQFFVRVHFWPQRCAKGSNIDEGTRVKFSDTYFF